MDHPTQPISSQVFYPSTDTNIGVQVEQVINGVNVGSATVAGTWDNSKWIGNLIAMQAQGQGQGQGGFTETDRQQLQLAVENTTTSIPSSVVGGLVNAGLGKLFDVIPPGLLIRHGSSIHLTGNGTLVAGNEPFANYALGIEWIFDQPPPGFGRTAGNVVEYQTRMVQWMPVFQDNTGSSYWANLVDAHEAGQRLVWGTRVPHNLNYWIAPGLGLTLTFLAANIPG